MAAEQTPTVRWAQLRNKLFLTVLIPSIEDARVELTTKGLCLTATGATPRVIGDAEDDGDGSSALRRRGGGARVPYRLELEFFAGIKPRMSTWTAFRQSVRLTVQKAHTTTYWPRLVTAEAKHVSPVHTRTLFFI